jgi:hypothetical protein
MISNNEETRTIILSLNELEAFLLHKCITFTLNHKKTNVDATIKQILKELAKKDSLNFSIHTPLWKIHLFFIITI